MAQIDSVGQAIKAIRRRAIMVSVIIVLGTLASVWFAMSKQRVYEASSSIQIEMPQIAMAPGSGAGSQIENRIRLIEQKLLSRETMIELADRHGLLRPEDGFSESLRVDMLRDSIMIQRLADPAQSWRTDLAPTGIRFVVMLGDPVIAAAVANDLLDLVMREGRDRATTRADNTLSFFLSEEARVREEIAQVEAQIAELKSERSGALPEAAGARTDRLAMLREAQLELEQQIIGFETGRDRLRDEEARRQAVLLEQQALLLEDRIAEVQALIDAAPEVERELNMLERNRARLQDEFTAVTTRRADAAMSQVLENTDQSERFEVLETALVPDVPISTSRRELVLSGVIASVIMALGLALGLEWMSPYLRTSAQIERTLGIRPVVVIPDLRIPRARRLT
ncbi:MAG: chain-length determining protein [Rhodobacterales bacterium]|nr:chain-length determining protein [Rhodobacterales bacterium]MDX5390208.1 chain-length determining protein [Rhodobacterales bacterium]MDX5489896.1 chain-length determining protein [Rhodobacterales bacterium]